MKGCERTFRLLLILTVKTVLIYTRGLQTFLVKSKVVNILGTMSHRVALLNRVMVE